ncbi:hypothetical protein SEA_BIPPER_134 [Mycobacterium phage Bipper]|uniref:Uncharacterized protein n=1 Tax=Mycobacterium phage Bipper TaxID=1805457 RepID=A0A142F2R2_9CAUD|nr:hypothetical protein KCH39_gp043 [Mycobacterium phage Bipper]AMQ67069.1 hypothetical protein SEA_BIPPER_134 [Mycobacterium phage Bipper]
MNNFRLRDPRGSVIGYGTRWPDGRITVHWPDYPMEPTPFPSLASLMRRTGPLNVEVDWVGGPPDTGSVGMEYRSHAELLARLI